MDFEERYKKLNAAQRRAVDTIDGPVMVIAGPGTGKTELLSMRVAAILQKTDTLPENILCLTYTESGANAMRNRLIEIIGKDAYKVAIHTFHSFGSDVINQNRQYFYRGASFQPADTVSTYEILRRILKELPLSDPLSSSMNDEFTYQSDVRQVISELKRSGLTSSELLVILDQNEVAVEVIERVLGPHVQDRVSKKVVTSLQSALEELQSLPGEPSLYEVPPLLSVITAGLATALDQADTASSTTPISAWKRRLFEKNSAGEQVLKARNQQKKLRSVAAIYERYMAEMEKAELFDYDDMILQVVHAIEVNDDLRFNLQEKYQYLLVDEFQDTNLAQMRILHNLTDNPVNEDRPNIFIVGDDDQAIYSFQGADISNILNFKATYPRAEQIVLTDNYRSSQIILDSAREIIVQGSGRLENTDEAINKSLLAAASGTHQPTIVELPTSSSERQWLAYSIKDLIKRGTPPQDIAVLFHHHRDIEALLPFLAKHAIPVSYERRDNVLELEPIVLLEKVGRLIWLLSASRHDEANGLLPEILSHPAWNISPATLWKLSSTSYDQRKRWLDVMEAFPELSDIRNWIIELVADVGFTPLEIMIDRIFGVPSDNSVGFVSPLYQYFFDPDTHKENPEAYLVFIESLRLLRTRLADYHPSEPSTISSFIEFLDLYRRTGERLQLITSTALHADAVHLMTAHSAKGLEFDTVFIANVTDKEWGEKAKGRPRSITYPDNLALAPDDQSYDERLRLFYVALTRAKSYLTVSYSLVDDKNKPSLPASFLVGSTLDTINADIGLDQASQLAVATTEWYRPVLQPTNDLRQALAGKLESYKLSASHLNAFIDVSRGGPDYFLLRYLLHFPAASSPSACYGLAIHRTLEQAHTHFLRTGSHRPIEDILIDYEMNLRTFRLDQIDYDGYLQKGSDELHAFLSARQQTFSNSQKSELSFAHQQSTLDGVRLNGILDLADIDAAEKTLTVYDYKTGRPAISWKGRTESEKIKLYKYRQQLLFYKLLVENSRDYSNFTVTEGVLDFVEPTQSGEISSLSLTFETEELERFQQLVKAVWQHIIDVNLPDIAAYEPTLKGILAFEQDLIDGNA